MNERERDKNAARRLAILRHAEEVTGNVALTCRYGGITRQAFYQWRRRYEVGRVLSWALIGRSRPPGSRVQWASRVARMADGLTEGDDAS